MYRAVRSNHAIAKMQKSFQNFSTVKNAFSVCTIGEKPPKNNNEQYAHAKIPLMNSVSPLWKPFGSSGYPTALSLRRKHSSSKHQLVYMRALMHVQQ